MEALRVLQRVYNGMCTELACWKGFGLSSSSFATAFYTLPVNSVEETLRVLHGNEPG